jgi:hypothetical protein
LRSPTTKLTGQRASALTSTKNLVRCSGAATCWACLENTLHQPVSRKETNMDSDNQNSTNDNMVINYSFPVEFNGDTCKIVEIGTGLGLKFREHIVCFDDHFLQLFELFCKQHNFMFKVCDSYRISVVDSHGMAFFNSDIKKLQKSNSFSKCCIQNNISDFRMLMDQKNCIIQIISDFIRRFDNINNFSVEFGNFDAKRLVKILKFAQSSFKLSDDFLSFFFHGDSFAIELPNATANREPENEQR